LSKYNVTSTEKYAEAISDLKFQFDSRFLDFKANEQFFNLFSIPFSLSVENVPENMQMEIIDLQNNKILKENYNNVELLIFIRNILTRRYILIFETTQRMMSLFGSTYTRVNTFFHE